MNNNSIELTKNILNKFSSYEKLMEEVTGENSIFSEVNKNINKLKEKIEEVKNIVSNNDVNIDSETIYNIYVEIVMLLNDSNIEKLLNFRDFLETERRIIYQNNFADLKRQKTQVIQNETKRLNEDLYNSYLFDITEKYKEDKDITRKDIEELALIKVLNDKSSEKNNKKFTDKEVDAESMTDEVKTYMKMSDYVNSKYESMKRTISMGYRSLELLKTMFIRKGIVEKDKNI